MYNFNPTKRFRKELNKLLKSKRLSTNLFDEITTILSANPFDPRLKTHKVSTKNLGRRYSSRIDGDLRIIWDFDENDNLVLLLLDLGGHEGAKRVYS